MSFNRRDAGDQRVPMAHQAQCMAPYLHQHRRLDDDIETFGTLRLTPRLPWKPLYRIQAWYFPVIYSFIALDFFLRDFIMVIVGKTDDNHVYPKMSIGDQITFWVGKVFFVLIMFVLPMQVYPWWQVIAGFFITMFVVGLLLGVVFQLAHINRDAQFPSQWAARRARKRMERAPGGRRSPIRRRAAAEFYIGGLNYQVDHLLPDICLSCIRRPPIVRTRRARSSASAIIAVPPGVELFACHCGS